MIIKNTFNIIALKKYITIEESDFLSLDDLLSIIEELYYECERLTEQYEDLKHQLEDNYEPINPYKMYGVSERDFS